METQIRRLIDDFERGRLSRRELAARLVALAMAAAGARGADAAEEPSGPGPTFRAEGIDHVALRVTDVEASARFYRRHLGLEPGGGCSAESCFLRCGDDFVALFRGSRPGLDHFSFGVPGYRPQRAVERLESAGLAPERRGDRVYFRDPDGIELQVSSP